MSEISSRTPASRRLRQSASATAIIIALAAASAASAADYHFVAAGNALWGQFPGSQWGGGGGGVPLAGDRAIFDRAGTGSAYTWGATRSVGQFVFLAPYTGSGLITSPVSVTGLINMAGIDGLGLISQVNHEITLSERIALTGSQEWRIDSVSGSIRQLSNIAPASRTLNLGAHTLTLNPVQSGNAFFLNNPVSGTGGIVVTGAGKVYLNATNTYSGGTLLNGGTLSVFSDTNLGGAAGALTFNGGVLQVTGTGFTSTGRTINWGANGGGLDIADAGNSFTIGEALAGGQLTKLGAGTLILTGENSFSGGATIAAGTLQVGNGGTSGTIAGDVANNGRLVFNRSDALTFTGSITGTGSVQQVGSGTTILIGASSHTGGTTISAGTLQLGNGGSSGAIAGNVVNNGTLVFNRSDASIFSGSISGSGSVQQVGSGTTILIGASSHTGGTTIAAGTLQLGNGGSSGAIAGNVVSNGTLAFNRSDAVSFDGVISGTGQVRQIGSGTTRLTGDSSAFTGATTVQAGALSVNGILGGTLSVQGGRLQGIGRVGSTINEAGGTIAPGNSIGTLTVNGDYRGNGGRLEIETVLGGDASPSDRLVVTGSTSGATRVTVLNQGGAGAPTVEGIKVVDVGAASNGSFTLANGDYVFQGQQALVAGAYAYRLQQNGVSTPNDGDWYLRSSYVPADTTGNPVAGLAPRPLYQPGVPLYEAYGQVLQSLNGLPTLRQRVGDRARGGDGTTAGTPESRAVWARIEGAHSRITPRLSTSGSAYEIDSWKLQAGVEGELLALGAGTLTGGLTAHHGTALADVVSVFGRGKIESSGTGFGGTLSWYGQSGFYADAQAQVSWFDSDLTSSTAGRKLADGKAGLGYALGLELGQRLALGGAWSLIPQAQLIYAKVDADSFTDPFGARVALQDGDSLKGRLGLAADYRQSWRDSAGQPVSTALYGIADLSYEFLDGTTASVAGTRFTSAEERLWGGLGLGAKYDWDRYSLYGEVSARTSLAQFADSHELGGRAGFRMSW